jgi:CDGSH-type Zn-finger protein
MEKGKVAGKAPKMIELIAGETYAWCACGKSANQPFCDGSHQGSSFTPTVFTVDESKTAALCMCKQTKNPPYCDGSHMSLVE